MRNINGLSLLVCVAMLCGLTGCGDANTPSTDNSTTTAAATTTTVATTTTTEAPTTTTTAAPVPEEPIVAGGTAFRLGDRTFHLGDDATELLAFLGEPLKAVGPSGDSMYDGDSTVYYYPDIAVCVFQPYGRDICVISQVSFGTDYYHLNGVSVGSSAAELEKAFPNMDCFGYLPTRGDNRINYFSPYLPDLPLYTWEYFSFGKDGQYGKESYWNIYLCEDKSRILRIDLIYSALWQKDFDNREKE